MTIQTIILAVISKNTGKIYLFKQTQTGREAYRLTYRYIDKHSDWHMERSLDINTWIHMGRWTDRQTHRHIDGNTDRQSDYRDIKFILHDNRYKVFFTC